MLPLFHCAAKTGPIELRSYQEEALANLLSAIDMGGHPVCGMATGGGKSVVIAALCGEIKGRVLVATHRKELLTQNSNILRRFLPHADYGIYSAGLSRRETDPRVIFGGIASIYKRLPELQQAGPFEAVIVDEAHRVPMQGGTEMYSQVLEACPQATRIGFSATPYRLNDGPIYGQDNTWFTCMPSHIGITDLTHLGYLTPLAGVLTAADVPLDGVRKSGGEFVTSDLSQRASEESVARAAVDELCSIAQHRYAWLVFCCDVAHTELITRLLRQRGIDAKLIVGTTPSDERDCILTDFREGRLRVLVNCQVGTEGFDIPCVDCVAMLRPSMSKALVVQMLGRGTRLYQHKKDCLVLDMAGNLARHVPLDGIPEYHKSAALKAKEEREEQERQAARERMARHSAVASTLDPMQAEEIPPRILYVEWIGAKTTASKKHSGKQNIMVTYRCYDENGDRVWLNHWLCPEYNGWPKEQAQLWFARRGVSMPHTAQSGSVMISTLSRPSSVLAGREGGYDRLKMEYFDGELS